MFGPEEITDEQVAAAGAGRGGFVAPPGRGAPAARCRSSGRSRPTGRRGVVVAPGGGGRRAVGLAPGDVESELLDDRFAAGYGWPLVGLWTPGRGSGRPAARCQARRAAVHGRSVGVRR